MRDGKIYLSIDDAVALTLENNLDIELARYNLNIADADLLRAKSGANILGVNTGIVQNTPGGGVGGLGQLRPGARAPAPTAWSVPRSAWDHPSPASIPPSREPFNSTRTTRNR